MNEAGYESGFAGPAQSRDREPNRALLGEPE
jgi:hypothetical protein